MYHGNFVFIVIHNMQEIMTIKNVLQDMLLGLIEWPLHGFH